MAQDDTPATGKDARTDETSLLKKRARRRLIGAVALALCAAIILPMVMDHQPAPPLKEIQVRIPSPDEGMPPGQPPAPKPATETKPIARAVPQPAPAPAPAIVPEPQVEARSGARPRPEPAQAMPVPAVGGEAWEVRLGAYADPGRVKNLLGKLKELGVPAYTEKVETPNGPRTRVRAGPFPSQEAAEKARARIKSIGVDGPVARKL